jgi:hypothetical protein
MLVARVHRVPCAHGMLPSGRTRTVFLGFRTGFPEGPKQVDPAKDDLARVWNLAPEGVDFCDRRFRQQFRLDEPGELAPAAISASILSSLNRASPLIVVLDCVRQSRNAANTSSLLGSLLRAYTNAKA